MEPPTSPFEETSFMNGPLSNFAVNTFSADFRVCTQLRSNEKTTQAKIIQNAVLNLYFKMFKINHMINIPVKKAEYPGVPIK